MNLRGIQLSKMKVDELLQSQISPPLVGEDKGEADIIDSNIISFTLTPVLSHPRLRRIFDKGEEIFDLLQINQI